MELTHESLSIDSMGVVSSVLLCIPLTAREHLRYINIECSPAGPGSSVPCFVRNSQCPELLLISAKELPLFSSIGPAL